jgi:hypothetical protein
LRPSLHLPGRERQLVGGRVRGGARRAGQTRPAQEEPAHVDVAAHKVREAGGPIDLASYVCLCGFAFAAAVSTSVVCPHCGEPQAW